MPSPEPTSPTRHWVLPFAASLSEPCQQALPELDKPGALPHLRLLLAALSEAERLDGDEYALSMPHERVLAAQMDWVGADGLLPWAAWWAAQDGVVLDTSRCWGMLSPGHWLMGRDHLTLLDPASLNLSEAESRTFFESLRELFESDGWALVWGSPTRWYAAHESLRGLPTASLDRVIGRNPDVWLTDHPQARLVRRLQSEVQMLLYQHPANDAREAAGLPALNSFWLSGCGQPPACTNWPTSTQLITDLRAPLLADDTAAWLTAWRHLDATVLREACVALKDGQDIRLTLCGDRQALTLARRPASGLGSRIWRAARRMTGAEATISPSQLLAGL